MNILRKVHLRELSISAGYGIALTIGFNVLFVLWVFTLFGFTGILFIAKAPQTAWIFGSLVIAASFSVGAGLGRKRRREQQ